MPGVWDGHVMPDGSCVALYTHVTTPSHVQVTPVQGLWRGDRLAAGDAWLPPPPVAAVDVPDDKYLAGEGLPPPRANTRTCTWTQHHCCPLC